MCVVCCCVLRSCSFVSHVVLLCSLFDVCCMLLDARCLPFVVCCLLCVVWFLLVGVCYSVMFVVVGRLWFVVCIVDVVG